jgi:LuxR family maltose regulon positive regulatory protein
VNQTLLTTKLNIPKLRSTLISRRRLVEKFHQGLSRRLTLISAPAGFGKTTLVVDGLNQLPGDLQIYQPEHSGWISLDDEDNEPSRFMQYLVAAIQAVSPGFGVDLQSALDQGPHPDIQAITRELLNQVADLGKPLLIVLDDYHLIQNPKIHQILQTSIDYLPPQIHLILTTRQDPPLSLPRWRARSWMSEFSAADLRFNPTETSNFLQHTMQLEISQEAVDLLESRTEGWVAGLQLAALSLSAGDVSNETVAQFGGRDRYVAEYLLAEVLDQQSIDIQQFLLPIAVLERFNVNLCTAVLYADPDAEHLEHNQKHQAIIESLEASNLFLIALDREGYWYRFHHLFTELLRQRLQQTSALEEIHT